MDATDIAQTGLKVAGDRLEASAANTANMLTDGYEKQKVEESSMETGGVKATTDRVELSEGAKEAAKQRDGAQNNVDLAEEFVSQMKSEAQFKANIATIQTATETEQSLLKMMT